MFDDSFPASAFLSLSLSLSLKEKIRSHALSALFGPGPVHSGSAS